MSDGSTVVPELAGGGGDLKADGTVPLTADWDVGAQQIRAETFYADVPDGTPPLVVDSTAKVANLNADQLDGLDSSAFALQTGADARRLKQSVRVATTANITLSGTQTIDGVSVVVTDRVLVKDQSVGTENGLYVVAAAAWSRTSDLAAAAAAAALFCFVQEGTTQADSGWLCTNDAGSDVAGTDALIFSDFTGGGGSATLVGLGDTAIAGEVENDVLAYDAASAKWSNQTAAAAGLAPAGHTHDAAEIVSGVIFHERGGLEQDVSSFNGLIKIVSGATAELKSEFAALNAPPLNADITAGYAVGSRWIDTTNDVEYVCLDATAGAAVWVKTTDTAALTTLGDLSDVTITGVTDNELLAWDAASGKWINQTAAEAGISGGGGGTGTDLILMQHTEAAGTAGGTATSGSWQTHKLNTEASDAAGHSSLAYDVITLAAGTYRCQIWAEFFVTNKTNIRLRDTGNGVTLVRGHIYVPGSEIARGSERFTLAAQTTLELQYWSTNTRATDGLGLGNIAAAGEIGVFAEVWLERE